MTLLYFYATQNASESEKEFLKKVYGKKITLKQNQQIKNIFEKTGALGLC